MNIWVALQNRRRTGRSPEGALVVNNRIVGRMRVYQPSSTEPILVAGNTIRGS